MMVDAEQE